MKLKPLIVALRNHGNNNGNKNKNGTRTTTTTTGNKIELPSITEISLDERISFAHNPTITSTATDGDNENNNNNKEFNTFCRRLKKNKTITKLRIKTNFLIDLSQEQILSLFDSISCVSSLREIHIQSSSRFHIQMIHPNAIKLLRQAKQIQIMVVEDMQITAQHKPLIDAFAYVVEDHPSLVKLCLRNFFANDWSTTTTSQQQTSQGFVLDPLLWTISTVPKLHVLEFSGCGSHALCGHHSSTTSRLVSPIALEKLLKKTSSTLQSLDISFLEFDDTHFTIIANHLLSDSSNKLTSLVLDYHRLGNLGLQKIMESMTKSMTCPIKKLSLRSLVDVGDTGYKYVMKMLSQNCTLEELSVTTSHPNQQAQIDLLLRMNISGGRKLLRNPNTPLTEWIKVLATTNDDLDVTRHLLSEIPGICSNNNKNNNNISVVADGDDDHDDIGVAAAAAAAITASPA